MNFLLLKTVCNEIETIKILFLLIIDLDYDYSDFIQNILITTKWCALFYILCEVLV